MKINLQEFWHLYYMWSIKITSTVKVCLMPSKFLFWSMLHLTDKLYRHQVVLHRYRFRFRSHWLYMTLNSVITLSKTYIASLCRIFIDVPKHQLFRFQTWFSQKASYKTAWRLCREDATSNPSNTATSCSIPVAMVTWHMHGITAKVTNSDMINL